MKGIRVCYFPKYRCFLHVGHETLREADACFRSKETHDAIMKRDGREAAMARSRRHRLGWHTHP